MGKGGAHSKQKRFECSLRPKPNQEKIRPIPKKKIAKGSEIVGNQFYRRKYYNEQANRLPDMVIGRNLIRVLTIKYEIDGRII